MFKRGISPIIATVLLIVLTLVAISILAVFVVPFVRESLQGSKSCVAVIGKIHFDDGSGYNCKDTLAGESRTGFSVTILSEDIVGFKATLFSSGSSDTYSITNGSDFPVLNGSFASTMMLHGMKRVYFAGRSYSGVNREGHKFNKEVFDNDKITYDSARLRDNPCLYF